jgi:hypothetical protein
MNRRRLELAFAAPTDAPPTASSPAASKQRSLVPETRNVVLELRLDRGLQGDVFSIPIVSMEHRLISQQTL